MNHIFEKIIARWKMTLTLFAAAVILCALFAATVSVNYDIMDYLPDDTQSTQGMEKMADEFHTDVPNTKVMISDITIPQALAYKESLAQIDGVEEVTWLDDTVSMRVPIETLDAEAVEAWYRDGDALFVLTIDTEKEVTALAHVREIIGNEGAISGSSANMALTIETTDTEVSRIMLIILPIIFLILLLTTSSWFEPVLFLLTIGVAIVLNTGTNAIFGEISFVTKAASSILQLAVSMDYSIFLLHRFTEYRNQGLPVKKAMIAALKKSFSSITASGMTTVIGFAALILMRFKIGPDMGLVMAKGIFFSLLCVLVLLPVLGILCYRLIDKTHHRPFVPPAKRLGQIIVKMRIPALLLFILITVPVFLAQSHNAFLYGTSHIFTDDELLVVQDTERIEAMFGQSKQMVLMVPVGSLADEQAMTNELNHIHQVSAIISYVDTVGAEIPYEYVPPDTLSKLVSPQYSRMVLTVKTDYESREAFALVEEIRDIAHQYYGDEYYLVGENVSTYDMKDVVEADNMRVTWIAIGAVALVLLLTFRSVSLPIILLLVIENSIWLNLSVPYFMGTSIFFIAYLIISSVQLGATVDYAILFAKRYMENRSHMYRDEALRQTITDTAVSILTSASILTVCGTALGLISTNGVIGQLGFLIGRGAIFSAAFVLLVLPALLMTFDGLTRRTTRNANFMER